MFFWAKLPGEAFGLMKRLFFGVLYLKLRISAVRIFTVCTICKKSASYLYCCSRWGYLNFYPILQAMTRSGVRRRGWIIFF